MFGQRTIYGNINIPKGYPPMAIRAGRGGVPAKKECVEAVEP